MLKKEKKKKNKNNTGKRTNQNDLHEAAQCINAHVNKLNTYENL